MCGISWKQMRDLTGLLSIIVLLGAATAIYKSIYLDCTAIEIDAQNSIVEFSGLCSQWEMVTLAAANSGNTCLTTRYLRVEQQYGDCSSPLRINKVREENPALYEVRFTVIIENLSPLED